jgi:hypothetical protein
MMKYLKSLVYKPDDVPDLDINFLPNCLIVLVQEYVFWNYVDFTFDKKTKKWNWDSNLAKGTIELENGNLEFRFQARKSYFYDEEEFQFQARKSYFYDEEECQSYISSSCGRPFTINDFVCYLRTNEGDRAILEGNFLTRPLVISNIYEPILNQVTKHYQTKKHKYNFWLLDLWYDDGCSGIYAECFKSKKAILDLFEKMEEHCKGYMENTWEEKLALLKFDAIREDWEKRCKQKYKKVVA